MVNEIKQTDQLLRVLEKTSSLLVIDDEFLTKRIDTIKEQLDCINQYDSNLLNDEMKYDLVTYKGLLRTYQEFIPSYKSMKYDNQFYISAIQEMRQKLLEKRIDKGEFDNTFPELKTLVMTHDSFCRKNVGNIIRIEKIYLRTRPRITEFYERNKKKCTEVFEK